MGRLLDSLGLPVRPRAPRAIRLEVSSLCQLRCPSCPMTGGAALPTIGRGVLDPVAFGELLDRNPQLKRIEISNYGELFLNPHLIEILQIADSRGVALHADNGANLNHAQAEVLDALVRYRLRTLTCSIDGVTEESYQRYRAGGSLHRVLRNIRMLNAAKARHGSRFPALSWQFVAFGHNEHEIAAARSLAAELRMHFIVKLSWDDRVSPLRDADVVRRHAGVATRDEFRAVRGEDYSGYLCNELWDQPQVNWDGRLLGCSRNFWGDFGVNVFETGLSESFASERIAHARAMLLGRAEPRSDVPCSTCAIYLDRRRTRLWLQRSPFRRTLARSAAALLSLRGS